MWNISEMQGGLDREYFQIKRSCVRFPHAALGVCRIHTASGHPAVGLLDIRWNENCWEWLQYNTLQNDSLPVQHLFVHSTSDTPNSIVINPRHFLNLIPQLILQGVTGNHFGQVSFRIHLPENFSAPA